MIFGFGDREKRASMTKTIRIGKKVTIREEHKKWFQDHFGVPFEEADRYTGKKREKMLMELMYEEDVAKHEEKEHRIIAAVADYMFG